ncbi:MAG: MerR family transcriptional regulator [Thermoanaerobaculales bacterium]|jgi:DNA-binding transcriptional MerR regulator|nr:MerR family transcriptional regulator [Thermoanaerobaculales bacterium]
MSSKVELPEDQEFFKLNEVCKLANVQPYMLRFWGTEFELLETTTTETGQRLYSRAQMNLILEIRRLLFDEGLTIAGARREVEKLIDQGTLDLEAPLAVEPPKKKPAARKIPAKKAKAKAKPKPEPEESNATAEPEVEAGEPEPEPEVDKTPSADVQPLLTTLRGVRKELAEIVEELKSSE